VVGASTSAFAAPHIVLNQHESQQIACDDTSFTGGSEGGVAYLHLASCTVMTSRSSGHQHHLYPKSSKRLITSSSLASTGLLLCSEVFSTIREP
jgi:hypothetical protein